MKLISLENLQAFKNKIDELFVRKEKKTGSDTEYRTLSDNNLTDELVAKINAAGAATEVTEEIATAKSEAITESKSYTDTEVAAAKTYTDTAKTEAITESKSYTDTEVATAKAAAIADAKTYTDTAKAEAVSTAKSYTDTEVAAAKSYADTEIAAAKTAAIADAKSYTDTAKTEAVASAKSYTDTEVASAKTALEATINTKISTAYKIKGSVAFASLPTLAEGEEGNVYNLTDGFTTTADFVEGAGKKYPAGSNIVCVEASEGVFKWDVLAGFIDTDTFVKYSDIENVAQSDIDALFAA